MNTFKPRLNYSKAATAIGSYVVYLVLCLASSKAMAACTSTVSNSSSSATSLQATASNQCVENTGIITTTGYGIDSYWSNPTIVNSGTVNVATNGQAGIPIYGTRLELN